MRLDLSAQAETALHQLLQHGGYEQSPAEVVEQALLHYRDCQPLPLLVAPKVEFTAEQIADFKKRWEEAFGDVKQPLTVQLQGDADALTDPGWARLNAPPAPFRNALDADSASASNHDGQ